MHQIYFKEIEINSHIFTKNYEDSLKQSMESGLKPKNVLVLNHRGEVYELTFDEEYNVSAVSGFWSLVRDYKKGYRISHEGGVTVPYGSFLPEPLEAEDDFSLVLSKIRNFGQETIDELLEEGDGPPLKESQEYLDKVVTSGITLFLIEKNTPQPTVDIYKKRYKFIPVHLRLVE